VDDLVPLNTRHALSREMVYDRCVTGGLSRLFQQYGQWDAALVSLFFA
jgi:hypothetical protein